MKRSSGILLPIFSLPSEYGIGTLGKEAYNFIDFLHDGGQRYWQMLPIGPTGFGDSPYQSFSSYGGNPYFIDLDMVVEAGLLNASEVKDLHWGDAPDRVDYGILYNQRMRILKKAYDRFCSTADFLEFCESKAYWLEDFSLFTAIKEHFNMMPWQDWADDQIRLRNHEILEKYRDMLKEEIMFHSFVQYLFFNQWNALRSYGKKKGVKLIGDIPIYVSMDSADAWASAKFMQFDEGGKPLGIAGVPPDYFSKTGQLWGNPLYDWHSMGKDNYSWWMKRIEGHAQMFDCVRIDHFRGLESYFSVQPDAVTAINGKWMKGPALDFVDMVKKFFPNLEIIAEDLGLLTPEVHSFVEASGFPGMKVLQFAFGSGNSNDYLPHRYEKNSVVYTGTHDNSTIKGWLEEEASPAERLYAEKYFGLTYLEGWNWGIIKGAMKSVANLCIVQMQDYLDLPGIARINKPGTLGGNWQWRLTKGQLNSGLAGRIKEITQAYER